MLYFYVTIVLSVFRSVLLIKPHINKSLSCVGNSCEYILNCRYKTRGDFASGARLIFNNCMIFNEDESDVGKAGHTMRKFFESRWREVLMSTTTVTKETGDDDDS